MARIFVVFCYFFGNFLKKTRLNTFFILFVYSFLGIILINCQEMDLIELLERSFPRSGLAHFPIIIDIIQ